MMAIVAVLKELGMSLVAAILSKEFLKPMMLEMARKEAEIYLEKAKETPEAEDDKRAEYLLRGVEYLEKVWK